MKGEVGQADRQARGQSRIRVRISRRGFELGYDAWYAGREGWLGFLCRVAGEGAGQLRG